MFIALDSQILAMSQGLLGSIFEKTQGKRYQSHLARLKRESGRWDIRVKALTATLRVGRLSI